MADDYEYEGGDMSTNDDVVDAVRDVESAVGRVEKAIENKFSLLQGLGSLAVVLFL